MKKKFRFKNTVPVALRGIGVTNFMSFRERQFVPIRPLTLLFGDNSVGKSAVIKAMKLISKLRSSELRSGDNLRYDFIEPDLIQDLVSDRDFSKPIILESHFYQYDTESTAATSKQFREFHGIDFEDWREQLAIQYLAEKHSEFSVIYEINVNEERARLTSLRIELSGFNERIEIPSGDWWFNMQTLMYSHHCKGIDIESILEKRVSHGFFPSGKVGGASSQRSFDEEGDLERYYIDEGGLSRVEEACQNYLLTSTKTESLRQRLQQFWNSSELLSIEHHLPELVDVGRIIQRESEHISRYLIDGFMLHTLGWLGVLLLEKNYDGWGLPVDPRCQLVPRWYPNNTDYDINGETPLNGLAEVLLGGGSGEGGQVDEIIEQVERRDAILQMSEELGLRIDYDSTSPKEFLRKCFKLIENRIKADPDGLIMDSSLDIAHIVDICDETLGLVAWIDSLETEEEYARWFACYILGDGPTPSTLPRESIFGTPLHNLLLKSPRLETFKYGHLFFVEQIFKNVLKSTKPIFEGAVFLPANRQPSRPYIDPVEHTTESNLFLPKIEQLRDTDEWDTVHPLTREEAYFNSVNFRIKRMGFNYEFRARIVADFPVVSWVLELRESDRKEAKWVSIQNVGSGFSQILPILLAITPVGEKVSGPDSIKMNVFRIGEEARRDLDLNSWKNGELSEFHLRDYENKIVCIQQPELHLHPKVQSKLLYEIAGLARSTSKSGAGDVHSDLTPATIVETHSELMVLRLKRMIRRKELSENSVSLLHLQKGAETSEVTLIELDEDGRFKSDWPGGFFTDRLEEFL